MAKPVVVPIPLGFVQAFLIIQDNKAVLVDTGLAGSAGHILRIAERHGITPGAIKLIILTHGHTDHSGSSVILRKVCGAPVAVHPLDNPLLAAGTNKTLKPTGATGRLIAVISRLQSRVAPVPVDPDIYLAEGAELAGYGIDAYIIHTPGHTPGSVTVISSVGDALIGDLLLIKPFGFGRPGYPFFIEDLAALNASIRKVLALNPRTLYAAHGGRMAVDAVLRWFAPYA
jgi:hydroxyacylglutathione hydrolase